MKCTAIFALIGLAATVFASPVSRAESFINVKGIATQAIGKVTGASGATKDAAAASGSVDGPGMILAGAMPGAAQLFAASSPFL